MKQRARNVVIRKKMMRTGGRGCFDDEFECSFNEADVDFGAMPDTTITNGNAICPTPAAR